MISEYLAHYTTYIEKYGQPVGAQAGSGNKVAIFLMVGMFYEMYDVRSPDCPTKTSFTQVTELLGLKVVVKKEGSSEFLSAGIPESAVHKWASRLTGLGWTVVLIDQVMSANGKVLKRAVQRVLTPGSHVESVTDIDMYMTFVSLQQTTCASSIPSARTGPRIALTALDLTTGHLHVFETQAQGSNDAWVSNDVVQFMELYPPKEVLWSVEGKGLCDSVTESKLKNILGCPVGTTFHQRSPLTSGAWLKPAFREDYLRTKCGLKSLLPTHVALHVGPGSHIETALLSLLYALEELWPSMNPGPLLVYPWVAGSSLRLGENALVQLHMITDDSKQNVLGLFDKCSSPMGHRGIRTRLLKPSADLQTIVDGLDAVEAWTTRLRDSYDMTAQTVKRLKSMSDVHRLFRKIQQGSIVANDLIGLDTTMKATEWLLLNLDKTNSSLQDCLKTVVSLVFDIFSVTKSYANAHEDTSLFVSGVVPALDALESQIQTKHSQISDWIVACGKAANVSPDTFKAEFREKSLVVKGPRGAIQTLKMSSKLPPNTVAVTNKTISYLESPELDQIFISLTRLREQLKQQQTVSLIEHGTVLADKLMIPWMSLADWITQTDVNLTLARVAVDMGYVRPSIIDTPEASISVVGLRHPIVEAQDRTIPYVQHTVNLGVEGSQGWLLYGLNASGKSSLMRATGIAVLLAQGGSFVPASKMTLSPFASLHTRIINTDNLWMGLSSFAVEMSEMRDIFREAGSRSLVLGDELCSGTETMSATALVAAGLKGLIKRQARFLFATHLHGLIQIPEVVGEPLLKIWHLHVEYDRVKDRLIYHRSLREGSGSSLYGLEVAKAMRIPDDILEDAIRFRKQLVGETELSGSVGSSWNSGVIRRRCTGCGDTESGNLEVHHIRERHTAQTNGRLADGSDVHAAANLVVLCDKCHDRIHGGTLEIGPMIQTSDGPERSVTSVVSDSRKSKWSEEELRTIESVCKKFPTLSVAGLSKYLLNQHDIQISVGSLRKMR